MTVLYKIKEQVGVSEIQHSQAIGIKMKIGGHK